MTLKQAAARLAVILVTLGLSGPVWSQGDELQEAQLLLKQGQLDRALDRVDQFLKTRPKDARGRFLRGIVLTEQNRPNDAIRVFTELTQDFPELPEPYNNLAVLHASQGQYDRARAALEAGQILPLSQILAALEKTQPGQVIEVELERDGNQWIYEIKLLQKNGHRQKIKVDASNANIISNKVK